MTLLREALLAAAGRLLLWRQAIIACNIRNDKVAVNGAAQNGALG